MAKKNKTEKTEEEKIDDEDQSKLQEEKEENPSESKEDSSQDEDDKEEPSNEDECEDDKLAKLNEDLERKDEEIIELKSHLQRLQADFDNFRKQGEKQKQDLIRYANEGLIVKFIDIKRRFTGGINLVYYKNDRLARLLKHRANLLVCRRHTVTDIGHKDYHVCHIYCKLRLHTHLL